LNPKTVRQLFNKGTRLLKAVPHPALEAKILLLHAASLDEKDFYSDPGARLPEKVERGFLGLIRKRLAGHPLDHLTGRKEFWSLPFKVGPGVLAPRPETELVVEKAVESAAGRRPSILDVGTGSGNIAIALSRELPLARITAVDISARALKIARANAAVLNAVGVRFIRSDILSAFGKPRPLFDIIVSNPPYVSRREWTELATEVRDHEPKRALVGGDKGTEFIEKLIRRSHGFLRSGGRLVMEIGAGQKDDVRSLFGDGWDEIEFTRDLAGVPRVVAARRHRTRPISS
jgi:release factor glutamine methyltransferase